MLDKYKGLVTLDILGRKCGFKFGTMQAALFCKEMKCKLPEMAGLLDGSDLDAQITWYWAAAVSYSRLLKQEEPSKDEVAAWIDSFGFSAMEQQASEAMISPNENAPTQTEEGQ